jgi:hypothetical protein
MLNQFQALSSKAMLPDAVDGRTLRLNDITDSRRDYLYQFWERVIA